MSYFNFQYNTRVRINVHSLWRLFSVFVWHIDRKLTRAHPAGDYWYYIGGMVVHFIYDLNRFFIICAAYSICALLTGKLSGINEATLRSADKRSGYTAYGHSHCVVTGRYDRTRAVGPQHGTEISCPLDRRRLDRLPERTRRETNGLGFST